MNQDTENAPRFETVRPGADIFARVKELIRDYRRDDPFGLVTVVVPSNYSSFYLRRRLAPSGYFNVELTRLDDLAEKIGSPRVGRPPLTRLQAAALVYSAAMATAPGSRLGPIRSHPSLHAALRRTFRELDSLERDPVPSLQRGGELDREVADVYRKYRESRGNWREQVEVARAAASALEKEDYPAAGLGKLIALRIEPAPPQFAPLERALSRVPGASILVALTGDVESDGLVLSNVRRPGSADASEEMPDRDRSVKLISAPDRAGEVRHVVRDVVRRAREDATPFYRMAVLFDDYAYGDRVEEALGLARVPVSGPDPVPDSSSPEGRFITGALDLFLAHQKGGWTRQDFTKWITSAPVAFPGTGREVPAGRWDSVSRSASVTAGLAGFRARLGRYARSQRAYADRIPDSDELHEVRSSSLRTQALHAEEMLEFAEGLAARAPVSGRSDLRTHARWLRELWKAYLLRPVEPTAVMERVEEFLDEMEGIEFPAGESMDLQSFSTLVLDELDRRKGSLRHLGRGVFVAPLAMAVGCEFDVVYILGMSEGSYPGRDREEPLLPDRVKVKLDPSGETMPDRQHRAQLVRRAYLLARNSAPEQHLYWPRGEAGARRGKGPARWFLDAAREVSGKPLLQPRDLLSDSPDNLVAVLPDEAPAHAAISVPSDLHEYRLKSADAWRCAAREPGDHFLASDASSPLHTGLKLEAARLTGDWTSFDGNLGRDRIGTSRLGVVSASRFESWANCPYQYFLAYVAGVEPTERPEDEPCITPLERGSIVHDVLEHFVLERLERQIASRAEQIDLLRELVARSFDKFEGDGSAVPAALLTIERESTERKLERWLSAESKIMAEWGVSPYKAEFEFGFRDSDAPAVAVMTEGGETVRFRGKVDRIDRSPDGDRILVFDYKTGKAGSYAGLKKDPVMKGTALQLPLYTRAAEALPHSDSGKPVVLAAYWFVFDGDGGVLRPDLAEDTESAERFDEVVSVIAGNIRDGVFPPAPRGRPGWREGRSTLENCRWCPYDVVCPTDRMATWDRKRGAPGVKAYRELSE